MALNFRRIFQGLGIVPKTTPTADSMGELEVITSTTKLNYHNGTTVSPVLTEAHAAVVTNKTLVVVNNTVTTAASGNLSATELNAALAELQSDIDTRGVTITAKDEGSNLTTAMSSIDFVGAGVTATAVGNAVTVTVNSGGDVVGPASSVDSEIALFDSTTGKLLKRATGTGFIKAVSGVYQTPSSTVSLTSEVSGVLPLANGGTNKNLTPVAGGIVYTDADSMEVTTAGTAGQILQSNGSSAPTFVNPSTVSSQFAYRSVTTTDTATTADYTLSLSGASFTQNLFTAVGNTGKILEIIHNGTSLSQVYTVDANGAQTIDGTTTYLLYTNGEKIKIQSDGANWLLLEHKTSTTRVNATTTLTGTTTNPVKGTMATDSIAWTRQGRFAVITINFHQTAAGTTGSGDYLLALPTGLVFNSDVTYNATVTSNNPFPNSLGHMTGGANASLGVEAAAIPFDTTHFKVTGFFGGAAGRWSSGTLPLTNAVVGICGVIFAPIDGWRD